MIAGRFKHPESGLWRTFLDRERLSRLHVLVEACRDDRGPHLRVLGRAALGEGRRLAVLPGSFNPLTSAHLALADAAERAGLGPVAFALSTHTVDKERIEGALLEDRLLVLELHAERQRGRLVALLNRGLYVDQAELLRAALPKVEELTFVVGFDKIVQIFDPRYYADREAALDRLFALAGFAVAPRAGAGRAELARLLERAENRRYTERVRPLDVDDWVAEIASSAIRSALAAGRALPTGLVPESVAFIEVTGCYGPDDRYEERASDIARRAASEQ